MDEIAEFNKRTLDSLRQPIEDRKVTISRVRFTNTYPANFMLVAAMNPCPCGYYGNERCHCTDYEVLKYRQKISGPILDRIDIQKNVQPVEFMKLSSYHDGPTSESLKKRVERARRIQTIRFKNFKNIHSNSDMTPSMIKEFCVLDNEGTKLLQIAFERFQYSARTYHKFLKVSRTFADMEESEYIMKENELIYWIWLSEVKGIGPTVAKNIIGSKSLNKAEKILRNSNNKYISIITKDCLNYPPEAKQILEMPILLYCRGNIRKNLSGVGIVGTRRCSEYGKKITVKVTEYLSQNNIAIISGMAKGIDSYAHTMCINSGGYTIAVLGCGVNICYPREHIKLMGKILENGALISQYPPGTKPNATNFPKRNKIISGISQKLLVVEAGEKSGSLITAKYAAKYDKPVYAAPGSIYTNQCKGTNKLLLEGAKVYLEPEMLLEGLEIPKESESELRNSTQHIKENKTTNKSLHYDKIEKLIIEAICKNPKSIEELILLFKDYNFDVIEKISIMELEGKISVICGVVGGARESI